MWKKQGIKKKYNFLIKGALKLQSSQRQFNASKAGYSDQEFIWSCIEPLVPIKPRVETKALVM